MSMKVAGNMCYVGEGRRGIYLSITTPFPKRIEKPLLFDGIDLIAQLLLIQPENRQWCPWRWLEICAMLEKEGEELQCEAWLSTNQDDMVMMGVEVQVDYHREHCKSTPFLGKSMGILFQKHPLFVRTHGPCLKPKRTLFLHVNAD